MGAEQQNNFPRKTLLHNRLHVHGHGLRTPNEGINERNLKFWADVADKKVRAYDSHETD